jgi:hypothetical protein
MKLDVLLCVVNIHPVYSVGLCITSLRKNGEFQIIIGSTGTICQFVVLLVPL